MPEALYDMESTLRLKAGRFKSDLKATENVAKRSFGRISGMLGAIGVGVSAVGAIRFIQSSTKAAASFQMQVAEVGTMLDEQTTGMLPEYSDGLRALSIAYGESTGTLSKGLYDVLSASVPASKALKVLEVSAMAAQGGLSDTGTAADAITTVLNSFKMKADDAGSVADFLFAVVKRGKTNFRELAPQIGLVAAQASAAGITLEEMGASLSTMTRNGVPTRQSVTALRAILLQFMKPTKEANEAFNKMFDKDMTTASLKSIGFVNILKKLAGESNEVRAKIIPSAEALTGLAAILGDIEGFETDIKVQIDRAGETEKQAAKIADTTIKAVDRIKMSFQDLKVEVGQTFSAMLAENEVAIRRHIAGMKNEFKNLRTGGPTQGGTFLRGVGINLAAGAGYEMRRLGGMGHEASIQAQIALAKVFGPRGKQDYYGTGEMMTLPEALEIKRRRSVKQTLSDMDAIEQARRQGLAALQEPSDIAHGDQSSQFLGSRTREHEAGGALHMGKGGALALKQLQEMQKKRAIMEEQRGRELVYGGTALGYLFKHQGVW